MTRGLNPLKDPNISYEYYTNPEIKNGRKTGAKGKKYPPLEAAKKWSEVDFSDVPVWSEGVDPVVEFQKIRDFRFIDDPAHKNFLRRVTWLYPDDGCYARADMTRKHLKEWNNFLVKKIFIFGNLNLKTKNALNGMVSWWYHVASVIRYNTEIYVFDPAIDDKEPLLALKWVKSLTDDPESVRIAVCSEYSYDPNSQCDNEKENPGRALYDQKSLLNVEWTRQEDLGRNPADVLGDNPPWK